MPYTENHALLRFGGSAYVGQEEWSCGLRLKAAGGDSVDAMQDMILATRDAVTDAVVDYFTTSGAAFNGACRLEWIRFNAISAGTGKYALPNSPNVWEIDPAVAPPRPQGYPQIAYCVTLRSNIRRGPAARGRWYVPLSAGSVETPTGTGVLPETTVIPMAQAAATFLEALASTEGLGDPQEWIPWLYGDGQGGPVDAAVQTVSVGNVADTQRRRREGIVETYFDGGYNPVNP